MNKLKDYTNFLLRPLLYILALICASYLVLIIEKLKPTDFGHYSKLFEKEIKINKQEKYPLNINRAKLTRQELDYAKIAWKYFENNYDHQTGMVNGNDGISAFSISDLGTYLMGMTSAYELNIIDSLEFDKRMNKAINSLSSLPLYKNQLPNKRYNTNTLNFYSYPNKNNKEGTGWSALDIGRFFVFINKIKIDYPYYFSRLRNSISNWDLNEMIINGYLYGIYQDENNKNIKTQEGTIGYEEYCAKGLYMMGYDVSQAMEYTDFLKFVTVNNIEIATDTRETKITPGVSFITSDPYILEGIEYGWNFTSIELAHRVFMAQKNKYVKEKIISCCSEDYTEKTPFYVYNSIYADKKPWNCFTPKGFEAENLKTISTKAAFGWMVLFDDQYAQFVFEKVKNLYDRNRGWYVGKYENSNKTNKTITASTNGLILEALNYKVRGKLINFKKN